MRSRRSCGSPHPKGWRLFRAAAGRRLDYGAPPRRADIILSMARINGVIEHAPHDLTLTVRAGTPLADLQRTLGEARQWLALDPPLAAWRYHRRDHRH